MADVGYRQDLPPAGGYKPIPYEKVPLRPFINGKLAFLIFSVVSTVSFYRVHKKRLALRVINVENFDTNIALEPLLAAERDREYLKQLRRNRDEEEKLMKNVPGWEVGTLFGEPLYKTVPEDFYIPSILREYYAHTTELEMKKSYNFYFHVLK